MNLWSRAQNSDRWTIFRQSNHGHNTLVIDGQLQRAAGSGRVASFSGNADFPHSVVDMSSVYQHQAKSVERGVAIVNSRDVLIQDQLTGLTAGSRVRWGMITPGSAEVPQGQSIELQQQDARLTLTILSPPAAEWRVIDTAKPRNEWDSPNRGTRMVAFEVLAPESGRLTLAVLATPGSGADSTSRKLELRPLENWGR